MRAGARSAGCIRLGLSGNRVLDKSAVVPVGSAVRTLAYTAWQSHWHECQWWVDDRTRQGGCPKADRIISTSFYRATEVKHKDRDDKRDNNRGFSRRDLSAREAQTGGRRVAHETPRPRARRDARRPLPTESQSASQGGGRWS